MANLQFDPRVIAQLIRRIVPERFRPVGYLTRLVRKRTGGRVRAGPFAGMRYVNGSVGSAYLPKLLGIYERELEPAVEEACAVCLELIVNLGAAEGYYAVGLALRNPQARILAFEQEETGRAALRKMVQLNAVGNRIEIFGRCDAAEFRSCLDSRKPERRRFPPRRPFVLCDVEGDEHRLLDPETVPGLRTALVLVETHDFIRPGITEELHRRFEPTHEIQCIWQCPRSHAEFPFRNPGTWLLPRSYLDWAISEWRPVRMCWLWMKPRERIPTHD